jgi:predicted DsbA family dithiol-disulfide isomerase
MTDAPSTPAVETLSIDVVSDVVCPWCYIGKRKLEAALSQLAVDEPKLQIAVRWHPFQLNPDLPAEGIPRASYLAAKFGANRGVADIYARVTAVGADVGIPFDFGRIDLQPNTLDAHRLIAWAQQHVDARTPGMADALVERLFRAYFIEGAFIGDREQLVRIAAETGYDAASARAMLASGDGLAEVRAEDREARDTGINGVPFFIFNGRTAVSGAHNPATLLEAMVAARAPMRQGLQA